MTQRAVILMAFGLAACGEPPPGGNATAPLPTAAPAAGTPAPAAPVRVSSYTPLTDKACRTVEEIEETGDWVGACPGASGYSLEWSVSDLRDDLKIIDGERRTQLELPSLVANGAFAALGAKAEWRGPRGGRPDVLVVRVHVADANGKNDSGRLALARLGASPCLVAIVPPGPGQSDRARAIADSPLPACLKKSGR